MGQVVSLRDYKMHKRVSASKTAQDLYERCLLLLVRIYPKMTREEADKFILARIEKKLKDGRDR